MAKAKSAKIGRPTLYKPEYCQRVVDMGKEGLSMAQMASRLNVARQSLMEWGEGHGEFSTALSRARSEAQRWWEDKGMNSLGEKNFQSSVWKVSMQARFREEYTERRDHNVTGGINVIISKEDGAL